MAMPARMNPAALPPAGHKGPPYGIVATGHGYDGRRPGGRRPRYPGAK